MPRRAPLAWLAFGGIAALLLIGVVAWQLLSSRATLPAEPRAATRADELDRNPGARAVVPPVPSVIVETKPATPAEAGPVAQREVARVVAADEFVLRVVDAVTNAPVENARAYWMFDTQLDLHEESRGYESYFDELELLDDRGASGLTDARGEIVLPRPSGLMSFFAEHEGRWARRERFNATRVDEVTLAISAADCVRVQVVDPAGRPVPGVSVGFGAHGSNVGRQSRRARTRAPDGIALVKDLDRHVKWLGSRRERWAVALLYPCLEAPWAEVDPAHPPRDPVVLTLPETGSANFVFVGRDDQPVDLPLDLHLSVVPHFVPSGDGSGGTLHSVFETLGRSVHGTLALPHVGPGLDFMLYASCAGEDVVNTHFLPGPARAVEHVEHRVPIEVGPIHFTGRILDERGEPLWSAPVEVRVSRPKPRVRPDRKRAQPEGDGVTGNDGRFDVLVPVLGALEKEGTALVLVTLADGSVTTVTRRGSLETSKSKTVDLGDLTLSRH